jgi:hypothetical protein
LYFIGLFFFRIKININIKIYLFENLLVYLFCCMMQVDSANKYGILLEVVQVLTDLNLIITKAYISSDGGWFMDGKILLESLKLVL